MKQFVSDTHAIYYYLVKPDKLGSEAKRIFEEAEVGRAEIYLPAIVLCELFWIFEKKGRREPFLKVLDDICKVPQFVITDLSVIEVRELCNDIKIPELHDRLIVGVARRMNATLLTKDSEIIESEVVKTTW